MSFTPQMMNVADWTDEDWQAYRLARYKRGATAAEVEDEILRMKAFDADRIAKEKAARDRAAQRQRETDAMMAAENQRREQTKQRLIESNNYWTPNEPWSPIISPPDPYGFGK